MATNEQELQSIIQDEKISAKNTAIVTQALSEMNFSEAAKKLLIDPSTAQTELDSLTSITLIQEYLGQIKESLGAIVDTMQENPSMINSAARFWGELPLWQRIIGGVVVSGPTLFIGAAAHIGFLVTISEVSALVYTTGGMVLDDHHFHTKNITQKLKAGVFGVVEVLGFTIGALDTIRQKLAEEIQRFQSENDKLVKNIVQLSDNIEYLSSQVDVYIATEKLLSKTIADLESKSDALKNDLEKQAELFAANQKEITKVKKAHTKSMLQLAQKADELAQVKEEMGIEVDKAKKVVSTLEGAVKSLSGAVINDSGQRQAFLEKLGTFLDDKSSSFDQTAERFTKAQEELVEVKSALKERNEQYKQLLSELETQIRRLEQHNQRVKDSPIDADCPSQVPVKEPVAPSPQAQAKEPAKSSLLLSAFGMLASPQSWIKSTPSAEVEHLIAPQ